jgi:hypothetical protein
MHRTGCGKTATLRQLARDLGLDWMEWINPTQAAAMPAFDSSDPSTVYATLRHDFEARALASSAQRDELRPPDIAVNPRGCCSGFLHKPAATAACWQVKLPLQNGVAVSGLWQHTSIRCAWVRCSTFRAWAAGGG